MPADPPSEGSGHPGPSSHADHALPDLAQMADTLAYVWRHFLDELLEARNADPANGAVDRAWGGARVTFRLAPLAGAEGHILVLDVAGSEPRFHLHGSLQLDPKGEPDPAGLVWHAGGDREELVAWMIPWVSLHVERGGGWIDL